MSNQITTAAELDSLPIGSVVMTETHRRFGGGYEQRVWMRHGGQGSPLIHDWQSTDGGFQRVDVPEHARGMWAANRNVTVLYRPDRPAEATQPSVEQVAAALLVEWNNVVTYGKSATPEGYCERFARAVVALYADAPTVAQVQARALREAAQSISRMADQGADGEASPYETADWLRARADRIESEAGR